MGDDVVQVHSGQHVGAGSMVKEVAAHDDDECEEDVNVPGCRWLGPLFLIVESPYHLECIDDG